MVAWPQSHVKHMFQTELGPVACSSLPYFALSETENKASLPWATNYQNLRVGDQPRKGACFVATCGGWGWKWSLYPISCRLLDTQGPRTTVALLEQSQAWERKVASGPAHHPPPLCGAHSHPHIPMVIDTAAQHKASTATYSHTTCPQAHKPHLITYMCMYGHVLTQLHS